MTKENLYDWSTTPASNTDLGGISVAEGWLPSTVNNFEREEISQIAAWIDDYGGVITTGGTANATTMTTSSIYTAYSTGMRGVFVPSADNTAAATNNLDGVGAKAWRKRRGTTDAALAAGDLQNGQEAEWRYDAAANGAAGAFILLNPRNLYLEDAGVLTFGQTAQDVITFTHAAGGALTIAVAGASTTGVTINPLANTGLHIYDTNQSHDLIIAPGSDLSADRTLTLTTPDSNQTIDTTGAPASLVIAMGTYTPTLTNTTNVAASAASLCFYKRVGDQVDVWGVVQIDVTASGAATLMGMTLPIASNLAAASDLRGSASAIDVANTSSGIYGDLTNDRASFAYISNATAAQFFTFGFSYRILA